MITIGDCRQWLTTVEKATLILADPPFGIGWKYDQYKDNLPPAAYTAFTAEWIAAARDALLPDGSLFISISDEYAAEVCVAAKTAGLHLRNWVIWEYGFGPHLESKWGRNKTHVLYFCKDAKKRVWNPIRVMSERQRMGDKRANPHGRVPGDVWKFSRICGTFRERTSHPCQQPIELPTRIVLSCSRPGDLVLSPFCGSGTDGVAAVSHGRRFLGCELSADYAAAALERVNTYGKA